MHALIVRVFFVIVLIGEVHSVYVTKLWLWLSCVYTVSGKKWNHIIFASNFASAGQFSKFFHQQA